MREPVSRPRLLRKEAACHLVLPLSAAFERSNFFLDSEFQRLIVSRLEMQARVVLNRAPIATVERLLIVNQQR